jgi:ribose transport system substrate-binding protein
MRENAMLAKLRIPAVFFLCCLVLGGCQNASQESAVSPTDGSQSAGKKYVAISVLTNTIPFYQDLTGQLEEVLKEHGYELIITSGDRDAAKQQDQVEDFIIKKVSAIVLCPCDSQAIGPAIKKANDAGIPVFTADIACLAEGVDIVSHVASDNYFGGQLAAKTMIEAIGGKGKIALLEYPEVESVLMRTNGFEDTIKEYNQAGGDQIEIVAKLPSEGDRKKAFDAVKDILGPHPDLTGVFAINDECALGAYAALESRGKANDVVLIGFDGSPEAKQAILAGQIFADVVQYPGKIGAQTGQAIIDFFDGEDVPSEILVPTGVYAKADAESDPALQQ